MSGAEALKSSAKVDENKTQFLLIEFIFCKLQINIWMNLYVYSNRCPQVPSASVCVHIYFLRFPTSLELLFAVSQVSGTPPGKQSASPTKPRQSARPASALIYLLLSRGLVERLPAEASHNFYYFVWWKFAVANSLAPVVVFGYIYIYMYI